MDNILYSIEKYHIIKKMWENTENILHGGTGVPDGEAAVKQ
jgi:2-hydroxy-3-keto-5-methylthiopentenyl-1-phosphate phosphatase